MEQSGNKDQGKKKVYEVTTFPIPFTLGEIKTNITINTNTASKRSKELLINKASKFHQEGNIAEAKKYYQQIINQGCNDHRVFTNYGVILNNLGKLQEAAICQRKAIEIKSDFAEAHSNLGNILRDLGKLEEARLCSEKIMSLRSWSILGSYSFNNELKLD